MSSRHFSRVEDPFIEHNASAKFFSSDLEYLRERNIPVRSILREALHAYVECMREIPHLPIMTKEQRDAFILRGILPGGELIHDRPDPGIYAVVPDRPVVFDNVMQVSPTMTEPRPDSRVMSSWTKSERDAWILTGRVPA